MFAKHAVLHDVRHRPASKILAAKIAFYRLSKINMRLDIEPTPASMPFVDEVVETAPTVETRKSYEDHLREGIRAAQSGDRPRARTELMRVVEIDPESESGWLWLASISEYPEELLSFLTNVLNINPHNQRAVEWTAATRSLLAKTFVQRGIDAAESGQSDAANGYFEQALEHDQDNETAWLWLASMSDSSEGKITYLERVLSINPNNITAKTELWNARNKLTKAFLAEARAAAVSGSADEADRLLDAVLAEEPDSVEAWELRAHLTADFAVKCDAFREILRIDPSNVVAAGMVRSLSSIMEAAHVPAVNEPELPFADVTETAAEDEIDEVSTADAASDESFLAEAVTEAELNETENNTEADLAEQYVSTSMFIPAAVEEISLRESLDAEDAAADAEPAAETEAPEDHCIPMPPAETSALFDTAALASPYATRIDPFNEPVTEPAEQETAAFENESAAVFQEETVELPAEDDQTICEPLSYIHHDGESYSSYSAYDGSSITDEIADVDEDIELPAAVDDEFTAAVPTVAAANACPFCMAANEPTAVTCDGCGSVLTLSDLEMVLGNTSADRELLAEAIARFESNYSDGDLDEQGMTLLGIAHLNMGNPESAYQYLLLASQLNPTNVVLASQANALLIRLQEIRRQNEASENTVKGKTILVVDDSPTVRKLISGKLEKAGHNVICSNDGLEAIEKLDSLVPDLVLLDITMPRMDGYQVCKMIRANAATKDIPVVMISGKDGFFDKVRGRLAGTSGYITKPFGPETLMRAVEAYLKGEFVDE